jgi:hypothetical protein
MNTIENLSSLLAMTALSLTFTSAPGHLRRGEALRIP